MAETITKETYDNSSLNDLIEQAKEFSDLIKTQSELKDMAVNFIQNDDMFMAKHLLDTLAENSAEYYLYDVSMGRLETPSPITSKDDLSDLFVIEERAEEKTAEVKMQYDVQAINRDVPIKTAMREYAGIYDGYQGMYVSPLAQTEEEKETYTARIEGNTLKDIFRDETFDVVRLVQHSNPNLDTNGACQKIIEDFGLNIYLYSNLAEVEIARGDYEDLTDDEIKISHLGRLETNFSIGSDRLTTLDTEKQLYVLKDQFDISKVDKLIERYEAHLSIQSDMYNKAHINMPTIECLWTEYGSNEIKEGKVYSLAEFDRLLRLADAKVGENEGYYKTAFEILPAYNNQNTYEEGRNSTVYNGRYDIGDGDGGIVEHIKAIAEWDKQMFTQRYEQHGITEERYTEIMANCEQRLIYSDYLQSCINLENKINEKLNEKAREQTTDIGEKAMTENEETKANKEIIIYDNYPSLDQFNETKELLFNERGENEGWKTINDVPESAVYEQIDFDNETSWEQARSELNEFFAENDCLCVGALGRWDGGGAGGFFINDVDDLLQFTKDCEYVKIYDKDGELHIEATHHDGTNYGEIRCVTAEALRFAEEHEDDMSEREIHKEIFANEKYSSKPCFAEKVYGISKEEPKKNNQTVERKD